MVSFDDPFEKIAFKTHSLDWKSVQESSTDPTELPKNDLFNDVDYNYNLHEFNHSLDKTNVSEWTSPRY